MGPVGASVGAALFVVIICGCTGQNSGSVARPGGGAASGGAGGVGGLPDGVGGAILGPASGRRLTNTAYVNTVRSLLGASIIGSDDANVLPLDEPATGGGFQDDRAALLPSSVRTDAYETVATRVAERVAWMGGLSAYATCTDPTAACREGFIRHLGRLMYRRPLTDGDVANLAPLFDADAAGMDTSAFETGARLVLQAMLQSPHFLYRLERLDNVDSKLGLATPSAFEIATRLSYLVWLSAPTPDLLDAAERGDLATDASFKTTVESMVADPLAEHGFEGYAEDWLQLYRLDARTPNTALGVTTDLLAELKEENLRFVKRIALAEGRDLTALFTDKVTELGPALAQVYGVNPPAGGLPIAQVFTQYDLANNPNRIGLLTQPGFLILRAAPARVTIVHRGLMVLRVFLCTEVPAPPDGAAAQLVNVPLNLTDRERFAMHASSPTCQGCHGEIDPLGYPFEPFDMAGRWRKLDANGNVLRSDGDVVLDGASQHFNNTAEFARLLAGSPSVQRCFVSKLFQFGMGRNLQGKDHNTLDEIALHFQDAGRTYRAAVTSVAASSAFRAMGSDP